MEPADGRGRRRRAGWRRSSPSTTGWWCGRRAGSRREVRRGDRDAGTAASDTIAATEALSRPSRRHRRRDRRWTSGWTGTRPTTRRSPALYERPRQGRRQGHDKVRQAHRGREGRPGPPAGGRAGPRRDHVRHRQGGLNGAVIAHRGGQGQAGRRPGAARRAAPSSAPRALDAAPRQRHPDRRAAGTLRNASYRPTPCPATRGRPPASFGGQIIVQSRVVTDQPWDVATDVLVIPIVERTRPSRGRSTSWTGAAGGELRALAAFGELKAKRFATSLAASRRAAGAVACWPSAPATPARLDREAIVRDRGLGGAPTRRPDRRAPGGLAGAAGRCARARPARSSPNSSRAASSRARTTRRRSTARRWSRAAGARRADPRGRARRGRRGRRWPPPSAASIIGEGANMARTLSNRAANDVSPEVLADEARAIAEATRPVDRRHRAGAGDRARHGHVHRGRAGQRQPAPDDRPALGRGRASATRSTATSRSSARASASTRAGSASSRPTGWTR